MYGVPGCVAAAQPVVMTDHGVARAVARPIVTGSDRRAAQQHASVRVRPGKDVVLVGRIAATFDGIALLIERGLFVDVVAIAMNVAMQLGNVARNQVTLSIVPRTIADAVAGVYRRLVLRGRGAEVGAPDFASGARRCREVLAMAIGAGEAAEVATVADAGAGDEEAHRLLGRLRLVLSGRFRCEGGCQHCKG